MPLAVLSQVGLWVLMFVNLVLILVIYRQFCLAAMSTGAGHDNDGIAVGRQAPPLLVRDLSLGMDLRQLKLAGRWSVVFFGTTSCEPCVDAMAQLSLALPELSACNVAVIAALNASHEEVQTLIEARSYGFDTYVDPEGASSVAWEVRVTPFALLLGPEKGCRRRRS